MPYFDTQSTDFGILAKNAGEGMKAITESRKAIYDYDRLKSLNELGSKMLSTSGTLPTEFIQEAAKQGIGLEGLQRYWDNLKGNAATAADVAKSSEDLKFLGRNPDAGREWNNDSDNDPKAITVSGGPTVSEQLEQMIKPKIQEDVEQGTTMDLGEGHITANIPQVPKKYSAVEEMLRYTGTNPVSATTETYSSSATDYMSDLTNWTPKDDYTNEYRRYASTLSNQLSANGYSSPQDYLQKLGSSIYKQNLYIPNQYAMYKDGKLDRSAYGAEMAKAEQSKIVAKGKADEAVMKARQELIEAAKQFGVTSVDNSSLYLNEKYKLRDKSYRPQAVALFGNLKQIDEISKQLNAAGDDKTKLSALVPTLAVIAATSRNPGTQPSEFSIEEVKQGISGLDIGLEGKDLSAAAGNVIAWILGGMRGPNPIQQAIDKAQFTNPDAFRIRMHNALKEYKRMTESAIDKYVERIETPKEREERLKKEEKQKDFDYVSNEEIKKTGWYNRDVNNKYFESLNGNLYKIIERDPLGYPSKAIDRDGTVYTLSDKDKTIGSDKVSIEEFLNSSPSKVLGGSKANPAPHKTPKKETAAERYARLKGKK